MRAVFGGRLVSPLRRLLVISADHHRIPVDQLPHSLRALHRRWAYEHHVATPFGLHSSLDCQRVLLFPAVKVNRLLLLFLFIAPLHGQTRPRARDLGITVGSIPTGPLNAITDVAGVRVGHTTIARGDSINTGITAILPHGGNPFRDKLPAAIVVGNGFGKLAGSTQVTEVGVLVQTNFGGDLLIAGVPVGRELRDTGHGTRGSPDGSIIMVLATDAPLDHLRLERLARRALTGLARTGSSMSNGSGDYVIAF